MARMDTFLDAEIEPAFHGDIETARTRAAVEAANTGAVVLEVRSIEARGECLVVVGTIPVDTLEAMGRATEARPKIRSVGLGRFHTTWRAVLEPQSTIGFVVLRQPLTLIGGSSTETDAPLVAIELKRRLTSLPSGFTIGPHCCVGCNEPIPEQRLRAVPGTRICTKCQDRREKH